LILIKKSLSLFCIKYIRFSVKTVIVLNCTKYSYMVSVMLINKNGVINNYVT